eukprot:TRINITY_DN4903_c0_g1_i5.p1 TRINITY_DN4903_c0_g1~~TRINITY_DN4903_c0_g1_i5.p1  ORF type:complete len:375 (+),score=69.75 TRINITY_DN4903_c0_g1_i5:61-1125(+)
MCIRDRYMGAENYPMNFHSELLAYGFANIIGALTHSVPVFASMVRTPIYQMAGARTSFSVGFTACFIILSVYLLPGIVSRIPLCVIAMNIIFSISKIVEIKAPLLYLQNFKKDFSFFVLAFVSTTFFGIQNGLLICLAASLITILRYSTSPGFDIENYLNNKPPSEPSPEFRELMLANGLMASSGDEESDSLLTKPQCAPYSPADVCLCHNPQCPKMFHILVIYLDRILYYANSIGLQNMMQPIKQRAVLQFRSSNKNDKYLYPPSEDNEERDICPNIRAVILDCSNLWKVDYTAARLVFDIAEDLSKSNILFKVSELNSRLATKFQVAGLSAGVCEPGTVSYTHLTLPTIYSV